LNNINWNIVNTFTIIFEAIIIFMYLEGFLENQIKSTHKFYLAIFLLISIFTINKFIKIPILTLVLIMLIIFIISLLYIGNIKIKILAVLILMFFSIASEMIALLSIMAFNKIDSSYALNDSNLKFLGILVSKVFLLILTQIVCLYKKRVQYAKINIKYWIVIFFIPIFSTLVLYFILIFNNDLNNSTFSPISVITAIGILYINIIVFYLFESLIDKTSIVVKNNLLEQQIQYQIINSRENELSQKQTKLFRHDIKNHLILIKDMIETDQLSEACNYITNICNIALSTKHELYTGNISIDSILNAKLTVAKMLNIKVEKTIQIPSDLQLDPVDSCILFGNIMDNAIEACSRINSDTKNINLFLTYQKNCLICKVTNTTDDNIHKSGQIFLSSKKFYKQPGIGLENIFNIIKKYNGTIEIKNDSKIFTLSFIIYNI